MDAAREAQPLAWRPMPEGDRLDGLAVLAYRDPHTGRPSFTATAGCSFNENSYGYIPLPPLPTEPVREVAP
jgi:hypothetical protein